MEKVMRKLMVAAWESSWQEYAKAHEKTHAQAHGVISALLRWPVALLFFQGFWARLAPGYTRGV